MTGNAEITTSQWTPPAHENGCVSCWLLAFWFVWILWQTGLCSVCIDVRKTSCSHSAQAHTHITLFYFFVWCLFFGQFHYENTDFKTTIIAIPFWISYLCQILAFPSISLYSKDVTERFISVGNASQLYLDVQGSNLRRITSTRTEERFTDIPKLMYLIVRTVSLSLAVRWLRLLVAGFYHCEPGSSPGQITWDLCWANRLWGRVFPEYEFPLPIIALFAPHPSTSIIRSWYNSGRRAEWTQVLPNPKKQKQCSSGKESVGISCLKRTNDCTGVQAVCFSFINDRLCLISCLLNGAIASRVTGWQINYKMEGTRKEAIAAQ
jgi:hypothetical protein